MVTTSKHIIQRIYVQSRPSSLLPQLPDSDPKKQHVQQRQGGRCNLHVIFHVLWH